MCEMLSIATRSRRISRREAFRLGGLATIAAVMTACGGQTAPASPSGSAAASSAPASPKPSTAPSASATLRIATSSSAGSQTPIWLAENLNTFAKYGVTVTRQVVAADLAVKALVSRDVDVVFQATPAILVADLNGGLDLVYIASVFNYSQFSMAVEPSIQSAADLKGKVIGGSSPGSAVDLMCRTLLTKLGLKPSDVTLRAFTEGAAIYAALLAGQIPAGAISIPQTFQAETKGLRMLTNNYDIKYQNIGPMVSKARLEELTPRLVPFLQGLREGIRAFSAQPELAKKLISENTKESDQTILQKTYDFYVKDAHFQDDMQPTIEGIQAALDFLVETTPAAKGAKPEQFVDLRVLEKLPKG